MRNKVEIGLFLQDSGINLYWNGGAFGENIHMFPVERYLRQFAKAKEAALSQFGEQQFTLEVIGRDQALEIKKGERFVYEPL